MVCLHAADVHEQSAHACLGILRSQEISHLHFVRKGTYNLRLQGLEYQPTWMTVRSALSLGKPVRLHGDHACKPG
jgi:hypothetical protein